MATKKPKPTPKFDPDEYNKLLDEAFAVDKGEVPLGHMIERAPAPPKPRA